MRKGIGSELFKKVVDYSKYFGAKRLEWQVLDWNEPAIEFYKKFNSGFDIGWINCRLNEKQIIDF